MKKRIYLDNNASTPIDPVVLDLFITAAKATGNPSSTHAEGKALRLLLMEAREIIADAICAKPKEIIFTSGGTEAINMVLHGIFGGGVQKGHLITSSIEHAALFDSVKHLESLGIEATYLEPGLFGAVQPQQVLEAIRPGTKLIALMAANNETGVKTDIEAIARIAEEHRIPFVVDAVSLFGKEPFSIPAGVSALCTSGHKLHAPRGVGFAYIRRSLKIPPLLYGGSQEFGFRAGTENLPGIAAYGKAVERFREALPKSVDQMRYLRDLLEGELLKAIPGALINGAGPRVCNTLNIAFPDIQGETLLAKLDLEGVAASHGSACASGSLEPSRVLTNMGLPRDRVRSSIRFSLSRMNTEDEIKQAIEIIKSSVASLR